MIFTLHFLLVMASKGFDHLSGTRATSASRGMRVLTVMLGSDVLGASNFVEVLLLAPATEVYFGHVMPRFEVVFESLLCRTKVCAFRAFGRNFHFFGSG